MGSKSIIEVNQLTHEKVLYEAAEKFPDLDLFNSLLQFRNLQLWILKHGRNNSGSAHKILISNLFINALKYCNSIAGRN
jgi:hypothetical protein